MNLEEAVAQLEAANATITKLTTSVEKLESKSRELQSEKQKARADADAAEAAREEAAERAEREGRDVEALEKRLTVKFQKDIDKLTTERDAANGQLRTVLVDNEIAKAIRDNNVRDGMDDALTALFTIKHKFQDGVATIDGKSISEYAAEYIGGEAGAVYRRPADHSGTGATGNVLKSNNTGRLNKRPTTPAEWDMLDAMPVAERNAFVESIGAPELKL